MAINRQNHRAERVNMLNRVQRDPAQHAGGRVAATVRHPGVRRFVNADREEKNDQLERHVNVLQGHCEVGFDTNMRFYRGVGN